MHTEKVRYSAATVICKARAGHSKCTLVILLLICTITAGVTAALADSQGDSTEFVRTREALRARDSSAYREYIDAAEELARMGLYTDALDMLNSLVQKNPRSHQQNPVGRKTGAESNRSLPWSFSVGSSFLDYNDIRTSNDPKDNVDTDTLQNRSSLYMRGSFEYSLPSFAHSLLIPRFYASNYTLSSGIDLQQKYAQGRWDISAGISAEKRLFGARTNLSSISPDKFRGADADSSDNISIKIRSSRTGPHSDEPFRYEFPVTIERICYRTNRPGYISHTSYTFTPRSEYHSSDYTRVLRASVRNSYIDYDALTRDPAKDTADVLHICPELETRAQLDATSFGLLLFTPLYFYDEKAWSPHRWRETHTELTIRHDPRQRPWGGSFDLRFLFEQEKRSDSLVWEIRGGHGNPFHRGFITYRLNGISWTLLPNVFFDIRDAVRLSAQCECSIREYTNKNSHDGHPLVNENYTPTARYIIESGTEITPRIQLRLQRQELSLNASAYVVFEHLQPYDYYDYSTKRIVGADAGIGGRLSASCRIHVSALFELLSEDNTGSNYNISLHLSSFFSRGH